MKSARRWVVWKYEQRTDPSTGEIKRTKVPYRAGAPDYKASATNARSWGTFAQTAAAYAYWDADGIGFVLGDGWAGVDFDHCRDAATEEMDARVLADVRTLNSYAESSPSGTGVHVLLHGEVPGGGHKRGDVEAYSAGRFFTVTGAQIPDTPDTVNERQDALTDFYQRHFPSDDRRRDDARREQWPPLDLDDGALFAKAREAANGAKFAQLWDGHTTGYHSRSEAVAALLSILAFWTRKDRERMDRFFRRSGLMAAISEKWEEKRGDSTWGACEIESAIEYTSEVYEPARRGSAAGAQSAGASSGSADGADGADDSAPDDSTEDAGQDEADEGDEGAGKSGRGPSIAVQLVALGNACEFFHDADREPWVTFPVGGHQETARVNAGAFWDLLERQFHQSTGRTANAAAKQEAQGVFRGRAKYDGRQHTVHVRLAEHAGVTYLDLADDERRVVRISAAGWELVRDVPVKFWRPRGMLPLPVPTSGGQIADLRPFVNITAEEWPLLVGFIVGCLRAAEMGGHPVLAIGGEQGSAKSTLARLIRALVDPNRAPLRAEPSDKRDLAIAAQNSRLLAFDNLSGTLQHWFSDSLCRISTGGGHATRQLYTDAEEMIFDSTRPIILTSIADVASKSDLVDRSIFLSLPRISEERRREESTFWPAFEEKRAGILGALLDAVALALKQVPKTSVASLPRMADFGKWVIAAEPALGWEVGTFHAAYRDNRAAASKLALDASLVGQAMLEFVAVGSTWTGTSKELLAALNKQHPENEKKPGWPHNPRSLSNAIRTIAPNLRAEGFDIPEEPRKAKQGNVWTISRSSLEKEETPAPPPPQSPPEPETSGSAPVDVAVDVAVEEDISTATSTRTSTHAGPGNTRADGASGGGGDTIPFFSNGHTSAFEQRIHELETEGLHTDAAIQQALRERGQWPTKRGA